MSEAKGDNSLQHILVVDDEELIVDLLHDYFEELGYNVCVAQSAEEAIEKLNNERQFNLVLTDINLPGKSGLDLLKIVRETRDELPVVLLTGLKTLDNAIIAVKSGAADYITKPFELDSVRRVVEKILKKQNRSVKKEQVFENLKYLKLSFQYLTGEIDPSILAKELAGYLKKVNFGEEQELKQYELAFTETLVNAVEHGSLDLSSSSKSNNILHLAEYDELKEQRLTDPNFSKRSIFITFECTDELFSFTVKDEGKGFDWTKFIDKSHKISKVNINAYGRGFNIIQHIIDEVHFNESGNMITLIKNRNLK